MKGKNSQHELLGGHCCSLFQEAGVLRYLKSFAEKNPEQSVLQIGGDFARGGLLPINFKVIQIKLAS